MGAALDNFIIVLESCDSIYNLDCNTNGSIKDLPYGKYSFAGELKWNIVLIGMNLAFNFLKTARLGLSLSVSIINFLSVLYTSGLNEFKILSGSELNSFLEDDLAMIFLTINRIILAKISSWELVLLLPAEVIILPIMVFNCWLISFSGRRIWRQGIRLFHIHSRFSKNLIFCFFIYK